MKKPILLIFSLVAALLLNAQVAPDKYYIQFTDKENSPYSIANPEEFLSPRAIERRAKYNIPVSKKDLPVNPQYLNGISAFPVEILNPTKWLNGVTIHTLYPDTLDDIMALPYVENIRDITNRSGIIPEEKEFFRNETVVPSTYNYPLKNTSEIDYGPAHNQIDMINGIPLHENGYQGQGILIAVLDAGFYGTDTHEAFDSLRANNQIIGTRDFVDHTNTVYAYHTHGTGVLSTMGANVPGEMVGTAPKASYLLLRTEESTSGGPENIIEEYNWVSGAELADSIGADLINSSLGYTTFDDPSQDHTYEDLDGNTAPSTIGADIAASRGIIVVNSAGNSGNSPWRYIGVPADGDSVFSIGAVTSYGLIAGFSSVGPTADGRIKPNVVAQGAPAFVANAFGGYGNSSGTSFSSPVICGMTACLLQAQPYMNNMEIMTAIMESGNYADNPNNNYGWGIPDYQMALDLLTSISEQVEINEKLVIMPVPVTSELEFRINDTNITHFEAQIIDQTGKIVLRKKYMNNPFANVRLSSVNQLSPGFYILRIVSEQAILNKKFIKQ